MAKIAESYRNALEWKQGPDALGLGRYYYSYFSDTSYTIWDGYDKNGNKSYRTITQVDNNLIEAKVANDLAAAGIK